MSKKGKKAALVAAVCVIAAFAIWWQGKSVAGVAEISGMEELELRDVEIYKTVSGRSSKEDVRFYRHDAALAAELADFLAGIECRYHRSSSTITYGKLVYDEDGEVSDMGQALYALRIAGRDGDGMLRGRAEIWALDDGRVYADRKCYYLKKGYEQDCITERLEEILRAHPEDLENAWD